jgi:hypothetical protein
MSVGFDIAAHSTSKSSVPPEDGIRHSFHVGAGEQVDQLG